MLKWLLGFLKTPLTNLAATLKANRTENLAVIEAAAGGEGATIETAVTGFIASEAKKVPELAVFVPMAEPEILSLISGLIAKGTNTAPELYDAGVAWVEEEATEV
jgi:hypothetical protein